MDNKYLPKKEYRVYQVLELKAVEPVYGLYDTGNSFENHQLAYEWIEMEGEREKTYTIVEEFRKP